MIKVCWGVLGAVVLASTLGAGDAQAYRKCKFGFWDEGERCERGPLICERVKYHEYGGGTKQWKCWHKKGAKWRPNRKSPMRKYHWF